MGEERIVHCADSGKIHRLNATAGAIWDLCDGRRSARDVICRLVKRFDVRLAQARKDVTLVLTQFAAHGLISVHDARELS